LGGKGVGAGLVQYIKILNEIEILCWCTPAKVEESAEWATIVNNAKENTANI
jgi:hypothetical protein